MPFTEAEFAELPGWRVAGSREFAEALEAFVGSCRHYDEAGWLAVCQRARSAADPRKFFEENFQPYEIAGGGLFTGYYQPLFAASRVRTAVFSAPIYAPPYPRPSVLPTRAAINENGLENAEILAWSRPVDAFFLAVQGSGLLRFTDGKVVRAKFAAKNAHPYKSIGAVYAEKRRIPPRRITADTLIAFITANPEAGRELMEENPSFVFFVLEEATIPLRGAVGVPLLPYRSLAVDFAHIPPFAPLWLGFADTTELDGKRFPRLLFAHDTGSAIKGKVRGDIFTGSAAAAGAAAGSLQKLGFYYLLMPKRCM